MFEIPSLVNFLHDLSLSVEIWQAIRNTDHKYLLHMGHRFFADDKIPGPYTVTCYYCVPCPNTECVELTAHNRIVTGAVVTSHLVQGNCGPSQLKHQQTASVPAQVRAEIKLKDMEYQLLTAGIGNPSVLCLSLLFMSPRTEKENSWVKTLSS